MATPLTGISAIDASTDTTNGKATNFKSDSHKIAVSDGITELWIYEKGADSYIVQANHADMLTEATANYYLHIEGDTNLRNANFVAKRETSSFGMFLYAPW